MLRRIIMSKKEINFVLCADDNYFYAGITMMSILDHLSSDYHAKFFILTDSISEKTKLLFEKIKDIKACNIEYINVKNYLHFLDVVRWDNHKNAGNHNHLMSYYRILILEILKNKVDKCIYVDSDMIVNEDLSIPYELVSKNMLAAAVVEIGAMQKKDTLLKETMKLSEFQNLVQNPHDFPYFNAGFIIFNIKKCNDLNIFSQLLLFLKKNPSPPYADQDTLNAIFGQKYRDIMVYLHPKYNVFCNPELLDYSDAFYSKTEINEAFNAPAICHFVGIDKPWKGKKDGFYNLWWKYCQYSPWKQKFYNFSYTKVYLLQILPLFYHIYNLNLHKFYLFKLPIFSIQRETNKLSFRLFNFLPLAQWETKLNCWELKLFKYLPLLKIKRKS